MLRDRSLLITGGTSVLGRALVRRSLEAQARVCFTYFQNERLARELEEAGARGMPLDLTKPESCEALKAFVKQHESSLDVLIHNAAVARDQVVWKMEERAWDEVIDLNLTAAYRLVKEFLPLLYRAERAKILFIASRAAHVGSFGASNYAASKAGLVAFAKSLAREVGRKGILVNVAAPGFLPDSQMTRHLPQAVKDRVMRDSVLTRTSDPDEAARHILSFLSDETTQVSGQVFQFDSRITP